MSYKVLYRKYRPDTFDSVVGQEYTISMLKNAINTSKNAHAYIFTGPRGTGKTSSAKLFAKALNCLHPINGNPCNTCDCCLKYKENPDVIEIDAASNNGVDEIRELINNVKLVPSMSKFKVYIIDEVHMLTSSAFNALLLTLEEPPEHVVFILATTDIQNVPITILSRCQRFDFKPIDKSCIINRLKFISKEESINATDEGLEEIALLSAGGMRDALGMLDQLSSDGKEITAEVVSNYFGSISAEKISSILNSIAVGNKEDLSSQIHAIKMSGTNYSVFIEKLIYELRKEAISIKEGKSFHDFYFEDVYNIIFDLNESLSSVNINIDPYILIEMILLKYLYKYNQLNQNISHESVFKNIDSLGNNIIEKQVKLGNNSISDKNNAILGNINEDLGNKKSSVENKELLGNNLKSDDSREMKLEPVEEVSTSYQINVAVRINNCFVECSKDCKVSTSKKLIEFMNYLMSSDRSLVSLLADTDVLAASPKYVLLNSKIDTTNDLINEHLLELEKKYSDFSGENVYFVAVSMDIWLKEVEKYRNNIKNKIKYEYMDEEISIEKEATSVVEVEPTFSSSNDIEEIAETIFGDFEIEQ